MLYGEDIVLIIFLGGFGCILSLLCFCSYLHHVRLSRLYGFNGMNRVYPQISIPLNVIVIGRDAVMIEQPGQEQSTQVIGVIQQT